MAWLKVLYMRCAASQQRSSYVPPLHPDPTSGTQPRPSHCCQPAFAPSHRAQGCSYAEAHRCDRTVGYGGSPDEAGETSLDALVMDGGTMRAGAVANLRRVRQAASAARLVMERTRHSLLAGEEATTFAVGMGLEAQGSLATAGSRAVWRKW